MALTPNQKKGGLVAVSAAGMAAAAILIPHWESGGHMDTTVRHQNFDPPGVYTVCDGLTNRDPDLGWIKPGMTFTVQWCKAEFEKALVKYVAPVNKCIPSFPSFPPHRYGAVLSFAYNLGPSRVCGKIAREFNAGHAAVACNLMGEYIKANGVVLRGLERRRFDPKWGEIAWCLKED